jgi:hypothetical protein
MGPGAMLITIGMVAGGLYLVHIETRACIATGISRPGLRSLGWILAIIGGLALLGSVTGR